jgi:hypothetical protein
MEFFFDESLTDYKKFTGAFLGKLAEMKFIKRAAY